MAIVPGSPPEAQAKLSAPTIVDNVGEAAMLCDEFIECFAQIVQIE